MQHKLMLEKARLSLTSSHQYTYCIQHTCVVGVQSLKATKDGVGKEWSSEMQLVTTSRSRRSENCNDLFPQ